jgi:hypothetical protein
MSINNLDGIVKDAFDACRGVLIFLTLERNEITSVITLVTNLLSESKLLQHLDGMLVYGHVDGPLLAARHLVLFRLTCNFRPVSNSFD